MLVWAVCLSATGRKQPVPEYVSQGVSEYDVGVCMMYVRKNDVREVVDRGCLVGAKGEEVVRRMLKE